MFFEHLTIKLLKLVFDVQTQASRFKISTTSTSAWDTLRDRAVPILHQYAAGSSSQCEGDEGE